MGQDLIDYKKIISSNGVYITQSLFIEYKRDDCKVDFYPYTLKERDHNGAISMYRVYMECETEYEAALKTLNSWKHWQILCKAPCFREHISKWREEREIREAAIGKSVLIKAAEDGNVTAAKSLIEYANKRKAGRPSNLEVEAEKKKQAAISSKVSNILDRMSDKK